MKIIHNFHNFRVFYDKERVFSVFGNTESGKKYIGRKLWARRVLCVSYALVRLCVKKLQKFVFQAHEICLYKIMADTRQEQRYVIQHYCRQAKTAYEVFEILKMTYGDAILSRAMVYQWYAAFRSGRESGKLPPGAPRTKLTDRMVNTAAAIMQDDIRIMVRGLANIL